MDKYNNLLLRAVNEFSIKKGNSETEIQWKLRLIYTILGKMALASLWDFPEQDNVSIVHLKKRVITVFDSYKEMYPELKAFMPVDPSELADEIYDVFLNTGCIYHEPNRIVMAAKAEGKKSGITFTRGYPLDAEQKNSGLGTFIIGEEGKREVEDIFSLSKKTLQDEWEYITKNPLWSRFDDRIPQMEYLRMEQPFRGGYWVNKPDRTGRVSIMRSGYKGDRSYFLYQYDGRNIVISELPAWRVEDHEYRALANACLAFYNNLPATRFSYDGQIVNMHFEYLPPPTELYLWKLYTWPNRMLDFPCDFNRICERSVFDVLKNIMSEKGYAFIEE